MDLLFELEAFAAADRADFDDHVAELAVTARLLLVAAVLANRFAHGLPVADGRGLAFYLDAVATLEAANHRVQMLVVDALEADFVVGIVMLDDEPSILLRQPLKRSGQLDVILAVGRLDGESAIARRIVDFDLRRDLAGAEPLACLDGIDLRDRDDIAGLGLADLLGLLALDLEHRSGAGMVAVPGLEFGTFADLSAEHPGEGEPADRSVRDLEGVQSGVRNG